MEIRSNRKSKRFHAVIRSITRDNPEYLTSLFHQEMSKDDCTEAIEAMQTADIWVNNNRGQGKGFNRLITIQNKEAFLAGYMCRLEIENIEDFSQEFSPKLETNS